MSPQESVDIRKTLKSQADSVKVTLIVLILLMSVIATYASAFGIFTETFSSNGSWNTVSWYFWLGFFNSILVIPSLYFKYRGYLFSSSSKIIFIILSILTAVPIAYIFLANLIQLPNYINFLLS